MTPAVMVSVASLMVAVAALIFGVVQRRSSDQSALADRLARLETKVDVFWRGVSFDAAQLLHSPHPEHARRDALLEAFMAEELPVADAPELMWMMSAIVDDRDADGGDRMAAASVLRYLRFWLEERGVLVRW